MKRRFEYDELVFEGYIAKAHKVGVRLSDGRVVDRDYIEYPGASVVLPVLDDGRIVMIRQYRFPVQQTLYELPAGTLHKGEDPRDCAARELTEETGYTARRLKKLGRIFSTPGTTDEFLELYLATGLTDGRQNLDDGEEIVVEIMTDAAVRKLARAGKISDAKTLAALGLYWLAKGM